MIRSFGVAAVVALGVGLGCSVINAPEDAQPGQLDGQGGQGGGNGVPCGEGVVEGDTEACYSGPDGTKGVGPCKGGERTCGADGTFGECVGEVSPTDETCNGEDDDCDGEADDGNPAAGDCDTGEPGVCAQGTASCDTGAPVCTQTTMPSAEICDGLDNDCNGQTDEADPSLGMPCDTGSMGACAAGTSACDNGALVCQPTVQPSQDVCGDLIDNDCDGTVDQGCCQGGTSIVQIDFAQTSGWLSSGCCAEDARVANGPGDTLFASFVDPTPPGMVITNILFRAGVQHACNPDPAAMQFTLNGNTIGTWNSNNGPDCSCGDMAVGDASYAVPAGFYAKGAGNTITVVHNAMGSCHESLTTVPGDPAGTAFRIEVSYACN